MAADEHVTTVRILGDEYSIRGASRERITALAAMVDARFRELAAKPGAGVDLKRLAVLTCLNLAEEIEQTRERGEGVTRRTRREVTRMRARLEEVLQAPH